MGSRKLAPDLPGIAQRFRRLIALPDSPENSETARRLRVDISEALDWHELTEVQQQSLSSFDVRLAGAFPQSS